MSITMIHADCMSEMAKMRDKQFDLAICDPPYGIGASDVKRGGQQHGKAAAPSKAYARKEWDSSAPEEAYFAELFRVSKDQIIWGGNYFPLPLTGAWLFWDKQTGANGYADGELAWTSFDGALRKFEFQWMGMIQGDMANKEDRIHPTQKPVALYKWLLTKYAKPGQRILDTHGGSGSHCIAAHDLGFDLVWMELDKDYYDAAVKRYQDHAAQGFLFDPKEEAREQQQGELGLE